MNRGLGLSSVRRGGTGTVNLTLTFITVIYATFLRPYSWGTLGNEGLTLHSPSVGPSAFPILERNARLGTTRVSIPTLRLLLKFEYLLLETRREHHEPGGFSRIGRGPSTFEEVGGYSAKVIDLIAHPREWA